MEKFLMNLLYKLQRHKKYQSWFFVVGSFASRNDLVFAVVQKKETLL